jgi:hypothetical protein
MLDDGKIDDVEASRLITLSRHLDEPTQTEVQTEITSVECTLKQKLEPYSQGGRYVIYLDVPFQLDNFVLYTTKAVYDNIEIGETVVVDIHRKVE